MCDGQPLAERCCRLCWQRPMPARLLHVAKDSPEVRMLKCLTPPWTMPLPCSARTDSRPVQQYHAARPHALPFSICHRSQFWVPEVRRIHLEHIQMHYHAATLLELAAYCMYSSADGEVGGTLKGGWRGGWHRMLAAEQPCICVCTDKAANNHAWCCALLRCDCTCALACWWLRCSTEGVLLFECNMFECLHHPHCLTPAAAVSHSPALALGPLGPQDAQRMFGSKGVTLCIAALENMIEPDLLVVDAAPDRWAGRWAGQAGWHGAWIASRSSWQCCSARQPAALPCPAALCSTCSPI